MYQGTRAHVIFVQKQNSYYQSINSKSKKSFLNITDENIDFFPRLFTITTKNGSYKFNTDILKDSSKTISNYLDSNPKSSEYHLDNIEDDDEKIMGKVEKMFSGICISFEFNELISIRKIIKLLDIKNCPDYMKPDNYSPLFYSIPAKMDVQIDKNSLSLFLKSQIPKIFTIKTNKKEYECTDLGVYSSKIIRNLKNEDHELKEYVYNFEDEDDEFQLICDLFNFENVKINVNNMDSLKRIAEDLQIEIILKDIDEFIDSYESSVQLIDDKKLIIETIDEIFYLLQNINILTVDSVKKSILNSIWIKTEENILELAACILQVVRVSYKLQPYLIDLIISLDESSNENDILKILVPFIVKQMKFNFYRLPFYCSFIFKMSQKGIITMKEILDLIQKTSISEGDVGFSNLNLGLRDLINILLWFIPELYEMNKKNEDFFENRIDQKSVKFFKMYFMNNMENYKKMRDTGEPLDDIMKAILYDDVDTLQAIISKRGIDINETKLPLSLFDAFTLDEDKSYINYAAENGSTKCFKYLLLNHAKIDDLTLGYAVYGGNTEIIRTVDQNYNYSLSELKKRNYISSSHSFYNYPYVNAAYSNFFYTYDNNYLLDMISPAIMNHQNDLFDWIFENKYSNKEIDVNLLMKIAFVSVMNGNTHSFIECIDKGLDLNSISKNFIETLINLACHNGFYKILQLILSLYGNDSKNIDASFEQALFFGNILIYKMINDIKPINLNSCHCLEMTIEREYTDIFTYIIESNNFVPVNTSSFVSLYSMAITKKNSYFFNYLRKKFDFDRLMCDFDLNISDFISILGSSCLVGFFEAVQVLTEFIIQNYPDADFTIPFTNSIGVNNNEICQYLLDQKVMILVHQRPFSFYKYSRADSKIFKQLLDKINISDKKSIFNSAIMFGNKELVEFLGVDKNYLDNFSLFSAVRSNKIEIVDLVLSLNSEPSFINQITMSGTALNVAVSINEIEIAKRLLSLPGINPNLYDSDNTTPLISAISNFNIEMINLLIDFYGDDIKSQMWQLNDAIKHILKNLSCADEEYKKNEDNNDNDDDSNDDEDEVKKESLMFMKPNSIINNKKSLFDVISRLLQFEGIDFNCHFNKYTLLSYACEINDINLVRLLLKSNKVNVNSYAPSTGNTPLMTAIENHNIEIAQLLIESPLTNINQRNYFKQTALTLAVTKELESIINLLVKNEKFDYEEICLNYSFFISNERISKLLLNVKGIDVNINIDMFDYKHKIKKNMDDDFYTKISSLSYITPLINSIIEKRYDMIDLIVSHPSFNPELSHVVDAVFISVNSNDIGLFRKLLKLVDNNVNLFLQNRQSLLYYSISFQQNDITTEILNNQSFDPIKSEILKSFLKAGHFNSINESQFLNQQDQAQIRLMNELCDYDENHGHLIDFTKLLPSGKSFFTSINLFTRNVNEVVDFLIDHGADPNLPDCKGVYPIQYAILSNFNQLTRLLLDLENIDLLVKTSGNFNNTFKNETILHLLARTDMDDMLKEILDKNLFDLNQVDDEGETPLMKACRYKKSNNITLLFSRDDLDYKHQNNKGDDALKISSQPYYKESSLKSHSLPRPPVNRIDVNDIKPDEKRKYLKDILSNIQSKFGFY